MKVTSVTSSLFFNRSEVTQKRLTTSKIQQSQTNPILTKSLSVDTVSFTGHRHAPNAEVLKALLKYGIPDLYSEIILVDSKALEKMVSEKLFDKPLRTIVKALKPYENSFFPVEKQIFGMMKNTASRNPKIKMDEFFGRLANSHSKKLIRIQAPIFEELDRIALELPSDLYKNYQYLRHITEKKLSNEEMFVPFSMKEFQYKLGRIKERIDKTKNKQAKNAIEKMYNMTKVMPVFSRDIRMNKGFPLKKVEKKQSEIFLGISSFFEKSALKNDKDLKALITESRFRIYKIPTNTKFNRKTFIHELKKITELLDDEKLARKMVQTAVKLPTSKENISAFIMKSVGRSNEQIGYDLFSSSIGTADHLLAKHKGGEDNIGNYALSSSFKNSEKAHERFSIVLRKNPAIRKYAQKQIDRLIELSNNGTFYKIGLDKSYITNYAYKLEKLSYPENPLILDLHKLK
jgi:hypothetical protein